MKAVNKLSEIFKEAGYYSDFTNRSNDVKSLNKAMQAGLKIEVIKKGFIRERNGIKFNLRLSIGTKGYSYKIKYDISPYTILTCLAMLIKEDKFNLKSGSQFKLAEPCSKCSGIGYIPYFSFYCDGICFDCLGLGFKGEFTTVNI